MKSFPSGVTVPYFSVTLKGTVRLQDLLSHIYVLIPVLDNDKHYWIGNDEVDKLLDKGKMWLKKHPEKDQITQRYLKNRRSLARKALEQLVHDEDPGLQTLDPQKEQKEDILEKKISLNKQRLDTITSTLKEAGVKTVIDLGCGEGKTDPLTPQSKVIHSHCRHGCFHPKLGTGS